MRTFAALLLILATIPVYAGDPLAGIADLLFTGKGDEAKARILEAQAKYRSANDEASEAVMFTLLAVADVARKDSTAVRQDLETAATRLERSGDFFGLWLTLWMQTQYECSQGRFVIARASAEKALAYVEQSSKSTKPLTGPSLRLLAITFGQSPEMMDMLTGEAAMFLKPILIMFAEAATRTAYANVLLQMGELEAAEKQLDAAAALDQTFRILQSEIEDRYGDIRLRQWRLDEARSHYLKAAEGIGASPQISVVSAFSKSEIHRKLADTDLLDNRIGDAIGWIDKALYRARIDGNIPREIEMLQACGTIFLRTSQFSEAEQVFNAALDIASEHNAGAEQASILADLGAMNLFRGRYGTAAEILEESVKLFHKANQPWLEAGAWILLAQIYVITEAHDSATVALDRADKCAARSGFRPAQKLVLAVRTINDFFSGRATAELAQRNMDEFLAVAVAEGIPFDPASVRLMQAIFSAEKAPDIDTIRSPATSVPVIGTLALIFRARVLIGRADWKGARALLEAALATNPSDDLRSGNLALIGLTYWNENNSAEATDYFTRAAAVLEGTIEDVAVEELLTGYLGSGRNAYFAIVIEQMLRDGRVVEAFEYAERARARAFICVLGNDRIVGGASDDTISREAKRLRREVAILERKIELTGRTDSVAKELSDARHQYAAYVTRGKAADDRYSSRLRIEPPTPEEIQHDLDANSTVLSYFVSGNHAHAWVMTRQQVEYVKLTLDETELKRILCWTADLSRPRSARVIPTPANCKNAATPSSAYELLIAPLRDKLHTSHLIIVPHGVLHYVPFAALRDSHAGRFLIEDFTISYVPSTASIALLTKRESKLDGKALVMGDPDTGTSRPRLSGALREARDVARALSVTPVLATEAREQLLYELNGRYDLIHIAAHGEYDADEPLFSRIALAPAKGYDGVLEVHEILSTVDLTGVNLVVLSACNTAAGKRSLGDEITGLTRALLFAGTPGVISTLWSIDDRATAELMRDFYARLLEGNSVADSLSAAQRAFLRKPAYRHPKYWAAFTLNGNPQARWAKPSNVGTPHNQH